MIEPRIFEFPLSLILAAAVLLCVFLFRNSRFAGFLSSRKVSVAAILVTAALIAVEGTIGPGLFHHWSFLAVIVILLFSIAFSALAAWKIKSFCALLSHAGLFLIIFGGFFGAADSTDAQLRLPPGVEEHMAYDGKGNVVLLPFSISLNQFSIDYYEDGVSPKQYTSLLSIDGKRFETSVNHPCRYKGYSIYQSGYDTVYGEYSILKVVRAPWLPVMLLGVLLLASSIFVSLKRTWNSWKVFALAVALAVAFSFVSVARINFGTLMPALRSLWFVPHLMIYMLAYAILAICVVTGVVSLLSARIPPTLPGKLLSTASSLLLAGMLCGAVWAQQAWGDYWTWDAKECWAAATWLLTLAGTHSPYSGKKFSVFMMVLAFLAMQMTWYGVNYLPTSDQSLHTYNRE